MGRQQFSALMAAAAVMGLLSGIVSWLFIGGSASAQKTSEPEKIESAPSKIIPAEEIRIVDKDQKIRATLSLQPDRSIGLHFIDSAERPRLAVGLLAGGSPVLNLADQDDRPHTGLSLMEDGSLYLAFHDQHGKLRAGFGLDHNGSPGFSVL